MSLIRGVLLAGGFRTQHDLNRMSHGDQRNTLIVELSSRTAQPDYQAFDDDALIGAGAVFVTLRRAGIRDDRGLKLMTVDDLRNTLIVEVAAQVPHLASRLQGMTNLQLVLQALGAADPSALQQSSFLRGVLLAGGFRTHHQLLRMSADDQRNTLIVELSGRTKAFDYQSLNDYALAAAGAVLVLLRQARIRDDASLRTMSIDDMRNTLIVELAAQTGLGSRLQELPSVDLVRAALGEDASSLLPDLPPPLLQVPPPARYRRLQFRLRGFAQFQSTDSGFQGARDEVYISATAQELAMHAGTDRTVMVEHFTGPIIGDVTLDSVRGRWADSPQVLIDFDLQHGGSFPRWYVVQLLVVEHDNEGVAGVFGEVKDKLKSKIESVVSSAVSSTVSVGTGALIGGLAGAAAGAIVGLGVGAAIAEISEGLANEVFTPRMIRTGLSGTLIEGDDPPGFGVPDWIEIREHGALYRIAYDWHLVRGD